MKHIFMLLSLMASGIVVSIQASHPAPVATLENTLTIPEKFSDSSKAKLESSGRKSGTVLSQGTQLDYFIEGEGFPCIAVTEGELISKTMSQELKKNFKFILLNARPNIPNPGEIEKISFDLFADDLDLLRKTLGYEKIGVFGHSITGIIALEYARKYPQNTIFVIMNGTPPHSNDIYNKFCEKYWSDNASVERKRKFDEKWKGISRDSLKKLATSDAGKLEYILDGPQCFYDYNFDATLLLKDTYWNMKVWNHVNNVLMANYDLEQDKPITAPVFLSLGRYDYFVPYVVWDNQKQKIPNLTIQLFEKSGHYPFYEEEELYRTKLLEWLRNQKIMK